MLGKCNYLTIDVAQDEQQHHLLEATVKQPTTHTQYVHTHAHRYTVWVFVFVCSEDVLHLSLCQPQGREVSRVVDLNLSSNKECKAIALRES